MRSLVFLFVFLAAIGLPATVSAEPAFIGTVGEVRRPAPAASVPVLTAPAAPRRSPLFGHQLRVNVPTIADANGASLINQCGWIIASRLRRRLGQLTNDPDPIPPGITPTDVWEMQIVLDIRPGIGVNIGFGRYGRGGAVGTQQVVAQMAMTVVATPRTGRPKMALVEARSSKNVIVRLAAAGGGNFASYLATSASGRDLISSVTDKALEKAILELGYAER